MPNVYDLLDLSICHKGVCRLEEKDRTSTIKSERKREEIYRDSHGNPKKINKPH